MKILGALVVGSFAMSVAAADDLAVESSVSPLTCLAKPRATSLTYPKRVERSAKTGIVRVRLTFATKDSPPQAEVFFNSAGEEFATAVLDFVAAYRLPCLGANNTVSATQEFRFEPDEILSVREAYDRLERDVACVSGRDDIPDYPYTRSFGRDLPEGTVLAKVSFASAHEPPKVDIVFDGGDQRLASTARTYFGGYRYVCDTTEGFPVVYSQSIKFALEGSARRKLKDVSLETFLGAIDKVQSPGARFDLSSMGCPFELEFELRQPYLENRVREGEPRNPNRREFVEWLRTVRLSLPESVSKRFIGDSMKIDVPCLVLDLR